MDEILKKDNALAMKSPIFFESPASFTSAKPAAHPIASSYATATLYVDSTSPRKAARFHNSNDFSKSWRFGKIGASVKVRERKYFD